MCDGKGSKWRYRDWSGDLEFDDVSCWFRAKFSVDTHSQSKNESRFLFAYSNNLHAMS